MIIISPFPAKLRNGNRNPKEYPYWDDLIESVNGKEHIVQIGVEGEPQLVSDFRKNLTISELSELLKECRTWIAVDSFFQHLAWYEGKPGIVLWGIGSPDIFGHKENINLIGDRKNIRKNIFDIYENEPYRSDVFVSPEIIKKHLKLK